jgi:hypothetical protein
VLASLAVKWLASSAAVLGTLGWVAVVGAQVSPAASTAVTVGDWKLTPVFDARTRVEVRHDLDEVDRAMVFERVRLGLDAQVDALETRLVLQDARAFDSDMGSFVGGPFATASTGVYEAWAQASSRSSPLTFVRFGRQPIEWGEGRLLGVSDASPTGRALYALRGRWSFGDGDVDAFAAALEDTGPQGATALDFYGELFGARAEWSFDPLFSIEAYGLARIAQSNPIDAPSSVGGSVKGETYTGSVRLHGDGESWAWGAEAAYQIGHASAYDADRAAWAAAAHVEHAFELVAARPTARVGASYASGDGGGATYRAFDPILPDVQTWHGAMDVFTGSNEAEVNARLSAVPWTDGVAAVEYRYVRLATPGGLWRSDYLVAFGSAPGNTDSELGHELDATLAWAPWAPLDLVAGYSLLMLRGGARAILAESQPGSVPDVSHSGFAQVRVTF